MIDPTAPDFTNTPISPRRAPSFYAPADARQTPAVSIVTPFYDVGEVFHETARSVQQQSFQQWEWIIVNDGSTDPASLAVLDRYREADPRVRVIDQPLNGGLSTARNRGFAAARTPYVLQLDGDDLMEPTALEKWFWFLESYPEYAFVKGYTVGFGAQEYLWDHGFHSGARFLEENLVAPTSLLRTAVSRAVGGYDETNRAGLEDWDFWLHCADRGYWGGTVPEYLDWYRRRPRHTDRWSNWDNGEAQRAFHAELQRRYPRLWRGGFPRIEPRWHMPNDPPPDRLPAANWLAKDRRRLLMIVPWLALGGADKFNLNLLQQLAAEGWEVTIATTLRGGDPWMPAYARFTVDVFVLHRFLRLVDYPRFLRYLIGSRQPDVVMVTQSELGYMLLPYLRAHAPATAFVDFCHIEEEEWKQGGYPYRAVQYAEQLDLNIVASEHLRRWETSRGAEADRVEVCTINVDAEAWKPDLDERAAVRRELELDADTPVILYAARLCAQKQPAVFAATMRELDRRGIRFVALVAGDGPDFAWLQAQIAQDELAHAVRCLGAVAPEQVRRLMLAADVFFLPSRWEGIALTIYEAMACGLPVVGAAVGGQREVLTEPCGVLIEPGDTARQPARYADILAELLANPERRAAMGQAARRRIESEFTLKMMGQRMIELCDRARALAIDKPRPAIPPRLAWACAAEAIEYARLFRLADELWAERQRRKHWRLGVAIALKPIGAWAYGRRWRWLLRWKDGLKARLLRGVS
jgi:glycosyltransferase involved in cell wall biosynthesis